MNERISLLRKFLGTDKKDMSQEKFGSKILMTRGAVNNLEKGRVKVTERVISDICREFNVNESWLRTGEGEMFIESIDMTIDEFAKQNGATALELEIVKNYFSLSKETRKEVLEIFFKDKI